MANHRGHGQAYSRDSKVLWATAPAVSTMFSWGNFVNWDVFGFHRASSESPSSHPPSLVLPWLQEGRFGPPRGPQPPKGVRVPGRPMGGGHAGPRACPPWPVGSSSSNRDAAALRGGRGAPPSPYLPSGSSSGHPNLAEPHVHLSRLISSPGGGHPSTWNSANQSPSPLLLLHLGV